MRSLVIGLSPDGAALARRRRLPAGIDLILLPELFDGGYRALSQGKPPMFLNHPLFTHFRNLTRSSGHTLIAGSGFVHHATPSPTNTSLVFRKGRVIHRYDKIHLFKPTGDTKYFSPGLRPPRVFPAGTAKTGIIICYDLRFPELTRLLAQQGMQLLLVPARWPKSRDDAWQSLLKARAIENQVFVAGCNSSDNEGGYSYVFDPMGKCIFSTRGKKRSALHTVRLDLTLLAQARTFHRNLQEAVFLKQLLKRDTLYRNKANLPLAR